MATKTVWFVTPGALGSSLNSGFHSWIFHSGWWNVVIF